MPRFKSKEPLSSRERKRSLADEVELPRPAVAIAALLFGIVLFVAVFSDPSGEMRKLGPGAWFYLVVLVVLVILTCFDFKRYSLTDRVLRLAEGLFQHLKAQTPKPQRNRPV